MEEVFEHYNEEKNRTKLIDIEDEKECISSDISLVDDRQEFKMWTGKNLKELFQWSNRHVRIDIREEGHQVVLITPEGVVDVCVGDVIFKASRDKYLIIK